jgi:hypothetical protein
MEQPRASTTAHCQHVQHENGLHELRFSQPSRQAVEELLTHIEQIMTDHPNHATMRMLINAQDVDNLPFSYLFPRLRKFASEHRERLASRTVLLYGGGPFLSMFEMMIRALPGRTQDNQFRVFKATEYDEAVAWLLQDD